VDLDSLIEKDDKRQDNYPIKAALIIVNL